MLKRIIFRVLRTVLGKHNIYGKIGKKNHFAKGILIYENAVLGNYNYLSPYTLINNCRIGNYCSVGPGCKLGLGEHDLNAISTFPKLNNGHGKMELFNMDAPAVIGHDVWLGANVVVKQGVHISTGAVIGAGAVVTKDVPPYAIAVGVPAKIMKYRFDEEKIQRILSSRWFEKNLKEAKEIINQNGF